MAKHVPEHFGTYFEPFLGGGAFLLTLSAENAVINDFNPELVISWLMVRDKPEELLKQLKQHQLNHSKEYYLHLREADRDGRLEKMTLVQRAARFIYMNKTGFNGLWRVNKKGQNNVPFGSYNKPNIADKDTIKTVSRYLNDATIKITNADFEKVVLDAQTGDFVYFDPPYIPISETSSFTAYSSDFGYDQQVRLRDVFVRLHQKGVHVMLSNSDVPLIEELYGHIEGIVIDHVSVTRMVGAKASSRKKVGEVIVHG